MGLFTLLSLLSLSPTLLASQSQPENQKHFTATAIVNTPDNTSSAFEYTSSRLVPRRDQA